MLHQEVPHLQTLPDPPQTHPQAKKLSITLPSPILPFTGTTSQHSQKKNNFVAKDNGHLSNNRPLKNHRIEISWKFLSSSSSSSSTSSSSASSTSGSTSWYSGWKSLPKRMRYSWITIVNGCTQRTKFKCMNLIVYPLPDICEAFSEKFPLFFFHSLCCPSFSAGIRLGKCKWTLSFGRSTRFSERKSPGPRAIPSERWKVPSEASGTFFDLCVSSSHLGDLVSSQMDVSENSGTPKSSILIGYSIINHPFWGKHPYFWKHPNRSILQTTIMCFH